MCHTRKSNVIYNIASNDDNCIKIAQNKQDKCKNVTRIFNIKHPRISTHGISCKPHKQQCTRSIVPTQNSPKQHNSQVIWTVIVYCHINMTMLCIWSKHLFFPYFFERLWQGATYLKTFFEQTKLVIKLLASLLFFLYKT